LCVCVCEGRHDRSKQNNTRGKTKLPTRIPRGIMFALCFVMATTSHSIAYCNQIQHSTGQMGALRCPVCRVRHAAHIVSVVVVFVLILISGNLESHAVTALSATETYARLIPCILNNTNVTHTFDYYKYPDDAEAHYKDLLDKTAKYRNHHAHTVHGYKGPWIENMWISVFMNKPLSYFQGMIPLFLQWVDIHAHIFLGKENRPLYRSLYEGIPAELSALLRPDVLYVTVSQDDEGIDRQDHSGLFNKRPNILTMSAGGYGHIPIPLVKGIINYMPPPPDNSFQYEVGFYGQHDTSLTRAALLQAAKYDIHEAKLKYHHAQSHNWQQLIASTLFNLAPRGYGRSSYRLSEVVQIGRIPVYIYNDVPWIAYEGSNISVTNIGFAAKPGESMRSVMTRLSKLSQPEITDLLHKVKTARDYYTLDGVISEIRKFFEDPLGPNGGALRCSHVPPTVI
jgi:hypothetical protein